MEHELIEQGKALVRIEEQTKTAAKAIQSTSEKILGNGQSGLLTRIALAEGRSKWALVLLGGLIIAFVGAFVGLLIK